MCGFSSPTLVSYKAFIWKASLEKTVLPPPDFVHSECTEVSEMQSKAQELTAHGLAHSCIQNPGAPVLRPPYECIEGKGVLSKGLPTAPLPRSPDLKENVEALIISSTLAQYLSTPGLSPLPSLRSIKEHETLFGTPSAGRRILVSELVHLPLTPCSSVWDTRRTSLASLLTP